jgi:hypothetical protein
MEILVIKRNIFFMLLFCTYLLNAQQRIAPKFIGDPKVGHLRDTTNRETFFKKILSNRMSILSKIDGNCYYGLGVFTFVIHQDSSVEVKSFSGKLPQFLVDTIKKDIEATKGMWTLEKRNGYTTHSYPFIFYVMIDISTHNCDIDLEKQPHDLLDTRVGYDLALAFWNHDRNTTPILELPQGYLLPFYWIKMIE